MIGALGTSEHAWYRCDYDWWRRVRSALGGRKKTSVRKFLSVLLRSCSPWTFSLIRSTFLRFVASEHMHSGDCYWLASVYYQCLPELRQELRERCWLRSCFLGKRCCCLKWLSEWLSDRCSDIAFNQSFNQSIVHSFIQSVNQSTDRSFDQPAPVMALSVRLFTTSANHLLNSLNFASLIRIDRCKIATLGGKPSFVHFVLVCSGG